MASGKSIELASIPKRTREWVHKHEVPDMNLRGVSVPQAANRAERRAIQFGRPWYGNPGAESRRMKTVHINGKGN